MKAKSIKKNFIYNLIFTIVNMLFPLVTAPHLSQVLGATGIGTVNFAMAIINWFILIAAFGVPRFAVREIAKYREDKKKISMIFWNLILIQAILVFILSIVYILIVLNVNGFQEDVGLYLVMTLMLFLNIFSIDWFYQGIEEYGYITIRNALVKVISVGLIFLMIQNPNDYILYAAINIFGLCVNNIFNYFHSLKYIDRKIYEIKPIYYLKQLKVFFYISLVVSLYTQLDQIFIGAISEKDLAFYVRSRTILNVGLSLTTALIAVISPRAAYLAHTNVKEYRKMVQKSINYIYLLGFPICVGLFLLATEAMYLLGGIEFAQASLSLKIMAPLSLVVTLGSWISGQILIPNRMEEQSFRIQCFAVLISIALNLVLIPTFSFIGATITWLIVETFLFIAKAIYANLKCKDIKIKYINPSSIKFFISALLMSVIIILIKNVLNDEIMILFVSAFIGAITYFIFLVILKEDLVITALRGFTQKIKK